MWHATTRRFFFIYHTSGYPWSKNKNEYKKKAQRHLAVTSTKLDDTIFPLVLILNDIKFREYPLINEKVYAQHNAI